MEYGNVGSADRFAASLLKDGAHSYKAGSRTCKRFLWCSPAALPPDSGVVQNMRPPRHVGRDVNGPRHYIAELGKGQQTQQPGERSTEDQVTRPKNSRCSTP